MSRAILCKKKKKKGKLQAKRKRMSESVRDRKREREKSSVSVYPFCLVSLQGIRKLFHRCKMASIFSGLFDIKILKSIYPVLLAVKTR